VGVFRKKPVTVQAERVSTLVALTENDWSSLPYWFRAAYDEGGVVVTTHEIYVPTLEGTMRANIDDWIVRGVRGELYPVHGDIFFETYEEAA
jgi:hypothetical protein